MSLYGGSRLNEGPLVVAAASSKKDVGCASYGSAANGLASNGGGKLVLKPLELISGDGPIQLLGAGEEYNGIQSRSMKGVSSSSGNRDGPVLDGPLNPLSPVCE